MSMGTYRVNILIDKTTLPDPKRQYIATVDSIYIRATGRYEDINLPKAYGHSPQMARVNALEHAKQWIMDNHVMPAVKAGQSVAFW